LQPTFFPLPDHSIVAVSGRDATAFAHAQFMSDVQDLAAGHWQWSGWLTPKGRVIALFALLKLEQDDVRLLLLDAGPDEFVARLQRFVFRSKVSLAVRGDLRAAGSFAPPAQARGDRMAIADDGGITLDFGAAGGDRTLHVAKVMDIEASADAGPGHAARWAAFDLAHGLPRLPASQSEQWTPQQLSLDRLRAYSVRKGCYPGQEVVARTHFLGQARRGLTRLTGERPLLPGDVLAGADTIGQLICAAGLEGLAVLPTGLSSADWSVNGVACRPLPLLAGLERHAAGTQTT
jgi:folate-binding protein YgfZ